MRIANILFDLDGTLVDSSPGIEYSAAAAITAVLPERALADLRQLIGPPIRQMMAQALNIAESGVLDRLEHNFRVSYDGGGWRKTVAYPGVAQMLSELLQAGVKNFIVTNKPVAPTQRILRALNLRRYFADVASLNATEPAFASKTEAAAYLISKHELNPEATILVGDSMDDARAAQACGLRFGAAAYGYGELHFRTELPVHIVLPAPCELISVIRTHNQI